MKTVFVVTVSGADEAGRVEALVEAPRELGAELLSSKVMRLDGQLSALLKVAVSTELKGRFESELADRFSDLQFLYSPVRSEAENTKVANRINLVVACKNRPGVQEELGGILERLDFQVEKMEYSRCRVANIGETVFSARCALVVPGGLSGEAAADEIEALAEGARVNVM